MAYSIAAGVQCAPAARQAYKWQGTTATYEPCSPYPSLGRFGDGSHKTVYVAESPEGAMAEFFRRHPELLAFQDDLVISLFELDLNIAGVCLDVTSTKSRDDVGIPADRLISSEADEEIRYAECRELATDTVSASLIGIVYPAAGAVWDTRNAVLFGEQGPSTWACEDHRLTARPVIDPAHVRPLDLK